MKRHFELYPIQTPSLVFAMPSRKMIQTLRACLQLETAYEGRPYGLADITESFIGLYKRDFLDIKINTENKSKLSTWYLTTKGLHFLLYVSNKRAALQISY